MILKVASLTFSMFVLILTMLLLGRCRLSSPRDLAVQALRRAAVVQPRCRQDDADARDDAPDDAPADDVGVATGGGATGGGATGCDARLREHPSVSPRHGDEFDDVVDPALQAAQGPPDRVP